MKLPAWLVSAWTVVRKLPVAKYINPVWKGLLRFEIGAEAGRLRAQLPPAIAASGPAAVDRVFDQSLGRLEAAIRRQKWLPGDLEDRVADALSVYDQEGRRLVKEALASGGQAAAVAVVDYLEAEALKTVEAL